MATHHIENILLRHEQALHEEPAAIRKKIGYDPVDGRVADGPRAGQH